MAVRATMASLILRVRTLINDTLPLGAGQVFLDQDIQDVMDASRVDYRNEPLRAVPTFSGSSIQYLDYYHTLGDWEDGALLKQYLITTVTPSVSEPIAGHWAFAVNTWQPVFITGSSHDVYRASADLLERWAAKWILLYSLTVDSQSFQRAQVAPALQALAKTYRRQQRPVSLSLLRSDIGGSANRASLGPQEIDRMSSG